MHMSDPLPRRRLRSLGRITPAFARNSAPGSAHLRSEAASAVRAPPPGAARSPRRAPESSSTPVRSPIFSTKQSTSAIREWKIAPQPKDLLGPARRDHRPDRPQDGDQRAELAAPPRSWRTSRTPTARPGTTWSTGRSICAMRVRRTITLRASPSGKQYRLNDRTAVLIVAAARLAPGRKARHWSTASRCPAALFDFGLYFFHNAKELLARGTGPYFYLPKMESAPRGAAVERHLRLRAGASSASRSGTHQRHRADRDDARRVRDGRDPLRAARALRGLNFGRWDYIFSCIKKFRAIRDFVLADRAQVTMDARLHARLRRCC